MTRRAGKQALIEQLIADGTQHIFGNPGTTEQGFMDALQDYPQLEFILALHEGVAVTAADSYARATRRPAFVELHIAPGLGNGMGMIFDAARGHSPLVIYAGQTNTHGLAQEPTLSGDLVRMAQPLCKWAAEAHHAADIPRLLRRAMKVAAEPPQGPVFLSLPIDVLDEEAEMQITPTSYVRWRSRPEAAAVQEAATLLAAASRPLFVVGDGVAVGDAQAEVGALAELVGAPIYTSAASEVCLPPGHRLWCGGLPGTDAGLRGLLEGADAIVVVGAPMFQLLFPSASSPLPAEARVIQVDLNTWELAKNAPVDVAIAADPKATLGELAAATAGLLTAEQAEAARRRADQHAERRHQEIEREREADQRRRDQMPIAGTRMWEELAAALPANAAVFDESITTGAGSDRYLHLAPGSHFRARGGGIGQGMGGTLGVQLAYPDRPVVGVVADGSAMYSITALWTAAHHQLPVTWVMCNNRSYRILKVNLQIYLGEAGAGRKFMATDFDPPFAFDRIAESMGVRGFRVERPEDLGEVLREAIAFPGPSLVDVITDSSIPGRPS